MLSRSLKLYIHPNPVAVWAVDSLYVRVLEPSGPAWLGDTAAAGPQASTGDRARRCSRWGASRASAACVARAEIAARANKKPISNQTASLPVKSPCKNLNSSQLISASELLIAICIASLRITAALLTSHSLNSNFRPAATVPTASRACLRQIYRNSPNK